MGWSVEAGCRGDGAPVPGSCSRTSHFIFLLPRRCGGSSTAVIFFRWQVIGLELVVQISTADEGKCYVVDAMMSMVGVVLDGGMRQLGHTPHTFHTFPLIVADGLQWKGGREASRRKKRSCPGEKLHLVGNAIKLLTRPIWTPACQKYLVGLALLTTHRPGHIVKAGLWPSFQRETTRL